MKTEHALLIVLVGGIGLFLAARSFGITSLSQLTAPSLKERFRSRFK